jgi:hypothetical protein
MVIIAGHIFFIILHLMAFAFTLGLGLILTIPMHLLFQAAVDRERMHKEYMERKEK